MCFNPLGRRLLYLESAIEIQPQRPFLALGMLTHPCGWQYEKPGAFCCHPLVLTCALCTQPTPHKAQPEAYHHSHFIETRGRGVLAVVKECAQQVRGLVRHISPGSTLEKACSIGTGPPWQPLAGLCRPFGERMGVGGSCRSMMPTPKMR